MDITIRCQHHSLLF